MKLEQTNHKLKLTYLFLYLIFIIMILFENVNIFFGSFPVSLYRIFLLPILFVVFFDLIHKKIFYIPKYYFPFLIFYTAFLFIGLEPRNYTVLVRRISVFLIFLISYNILYTIDFDKKTKLKISFIISIILFVSSITMFTDYLKITKLLKLVNIDSYKDFLKVGRPSSILGAETNFTASRFAALLPFSLYYVFNEKKNLVRLLFVLITVIFTILGIVLTGSRMGFITLTIIIMVTFFSKMTKLDIKGKLLSLFIMIILIFSAIAVIKHQESTSKLSSRMENMKNFAQKKANITKGETSIAVRFILFIAGLDMIKHHPIFGVGLGNSKYESLKYIDEGYGKRFLHNTFLGIGAENGIIILGLFFFFYFLILFKAYKRYKKTKDDFWFFFSLIMIVQFVNYFLISDFSNRIFWTIILPIGNLVFTGDKKI